MERKEFIIASFVLLPGFLGVAAGLYFLAVKPSVQVVDVRDWPKVPCVI